MARMMRYLSLLLVLLLLAACGTRRPAPVEERGGWRPKPTISRAGKISEPGFHTVTRGDTMYSIAFRYGLDWRLVAHWNGIAAPYLIHPGDRLRLMPPPHSASGRAARRHQSQGTAKRPQSSTPSSASGRRGGSQTGRAQTSTKPSAPARTAPPASSQTQSSAKSTPKSTAKSPPKSTPKPAPAATANSGDVIWRWPAAGPVLRGFSPNNGRQGVDVKGEQGQTVVAAADGTVVYSGTGLIGYGELIIIKHNDRLLSAYGHNSRRLVKEGDTVKAGQPISEMGKNSSGEAILHFEVRVEGKPQNPLKYLPKRS